MSKSKTIKDEDTAVADTDITKVDFEKFRFYLMPTDNIITIYGSLTCNYCHKAVDLLNNIVDSKTKVPILFVFYDIHYIRHASPIINERLKAYIADFATIPMIFDGKTFVGGFCDLEEYIRQGLIDATLNRKLKWKCGDGEKKSNCKVSA